MDFCELLSFHPVYADPKNSAKIYFACDEETYKTHFEAIEKQILHLTAKSKTTCTIWFRKHFNPLSADEVNLLGEFLSQAQLVIAPVTHSLLTNANNVMEHEIRLAKEYKKPILPIMLENGLVELYSSPENFGDRQFLNPLDADLTAIPFEKKLADYLCDTLINDATRAKIKLEFDAYIFLSYRKKDRAEARKLMRQIHQNDFCRDVAIWYDEYLIPGEDFNRTIAEAMEKSHLFTLMVTPNVVEPDNYIIQHEYPMAQELQEKKQLPILPVECVKTDAQSLRAVYKNIPPCACADTPDALEASLRDSLKNVVLMGKRDDPAHNFLIGLGYLGGIDMEIDYDRAISLITGAANANLLEAKVKLVEIYQNGIGTSIDYKAALYWSSQVIDQYKKRFESDKLYGSLLVDAYFSHLSLLSAMNEAASSEQTVLDAIYYAQYLPTPDSIERRILLYMFLKDVKQIQKAKEFPFEEQLPRIAEIQRAGIPALMQAEELALQHVAEPTLASLICYLLVGIYALFFAIEDKENIARYHEKVVSFCQAHYPQGLVDFEQYRKMDDLKQKIDWSSFDGVADYMELYLQTVETMGGTPDCLIPFVKDFADIIATLFRNETADKLISVYEKYVYRFLSVFESIPLKEADNSILAIRVRLYSIAADFAKKNENLPAVISAENKCILVTEEILRRHNNKTNRKTYFDLTHLAAKNALKRNDPAAAFRITKAAYTKWKTICEKQPDEVDLCALVNIYTDFAAFFKLQDKQEDAIAFYDVAAETAVKLCNAYFTVKNIILVAETHNAFAQYQYENGNYESTVTLCEGCLNACGTFMDYQRAHQEKLLIAKKDDDTFAHEFRKCLTYLSWAYHATKQYEKEEPLLRSFLDTWETDSREEWIEYHYYLGSCLLHQEKGKESAKYFEDYIILVGDNVTDQNRRQYAMSSYYIAMFIPEKADTYKPKAIEQLLVLFRKNPNDKHIALVLSQLLGVNPNQQEEET